MADPATWFMAASAVGTGFSAYGQVKQGMAAKQAAYYQASVAEQNAATARENAIAAGKSGAVQEEAQQQKARALVGALMAKQGASGVDVNTGSAVETRASQAQIGQMDVINTRYNTARQIYGYNKQASELDTQADIYRAQGKSAESAGWLSGVTTLGVGLGTLGLNYLSPATTSTKDVVGKVQTGLLRAR